MDAIKIILGIALLLPLSGCVSLGRDSLKLGRKAYNVVDIFGGTPALALARAGARGDVAEIKRQIAAGVDVNTRGKQNITPLWWTALARNMNGFKALLEAGADPNIKKEDSYSLMIIVTLMRDIRFLEEVLKHGGDPNFQDTGFFSTPLVTTIVMHDFLWSRSSRRREILFRAGADISMQNYAGETPMTMAIGAKGDYKLVWEFLQRGADYTIMETRKRDGKNVNILAENIGICGIDPNQENYLWREKVIGFLRSKGIEAHRPPTEQPRKKEVTEEELRNLRASPRG